MARLDERIAAELRDISRFGFEQRWSNYWPLVFEQVENDPASVADLRDAIIEIEERFARSESRPDLARLLGNQRALWQEEAQQVFLEFIEPFINSDGSREEREALYHELQQVKSDVQQKIDTTGRAQAFPEYVLALDYVTAFASTVTYAFSKTAPPGPKPAPRQAAPAPASQVAPAEVAPVVPAPGPAMDKPLPGSGGPGAYHGQPDNAPSGLDRYDQPGKRRGRVGLIVALAILLLVLAGAGTTAYMRPDLINLDKLLALAGGQSFDGAVDEFMAREASACPAPDGDLTVQQILDQAPCLDEAKASTTAAFAALVEKAGGTWSEDGSAEGWNVEDAERKDKLSLAWDHLVGIREAYDDKITQRILDYDGKFYPPDAERDALGWRFAVWLCACNERAEHTGVGDEDRAYRVFISGPELVTTPHTYQKLVTLLRDYFLGGEKLGDPALVAQTVEQFDLPHGITAGPRLGGPLGSRTEAEQAIEDVSAFYKALGFEIINVNLRS